MSRDPPGSNLYRLRRDDGRDLAWEAWGDPAGVPTYFFHGFPSSGALAGVADVPARNAGLCLIAPDRPGFGHSSPAPGRRILDWPTDVEALADHLGHSRFGVIGVSCGGPYALACALRLPDRVRRVALVAGMGPMNVPALRKTQLPFLKLLFGLARRAPWLAAPLLLPDRILARLNPAGVVRMLAGLLAEPDRALLARDPEVALRFGASMAGAYHQGMGAALQEAALIAGPRGFDLRDIAVPVFLHQPLQDRHVPPAMAEHMAARLPHANLRRYADEGHLSVLVNRFAEVAQDLRAELQTETRRFPNDSTEGRT